MQRWLLLLGFVFLLGGGNGEDHMALDQITVYASQIEKQRLGYMGLSLTEFDSTSEPQIAAGSKVEIGGALFEAGTAQSITGWAGIANDTDVYIKLTVSGTEASASFTTDAPTWSTSKQGWYDGDDRYIGGLYKDGSGNYTIKWLYPVPNDTINQEMIRGGQTRPLLEKVLEIGDWDMDAGTLATVTHGIPDHSKIRGMHIVIRDDNGTNYHVLPDQPSSDAGTNPSAGVQRWTSTGIVLRRETGGAFDATAYDSTSYNRGWIHLKYRA